MGDTKGLNYDLSVVIKSQGGSSRPNIPEDRAAMDAEQFFSALESAMDKRSMTLKKVAHLAGVPYERLKNARRRGSELRFGDALKIAQALGETLEEFVAAPKS